MAGELLVRATKKVGCNNMTLAEESYYNPDIGVPEEGATVVQRGYVNKLKQKVKEERELKNLTLNYLVMSI